MGTSGDFAQTNDCGATVAAGASCAIRIFFVPTAEGTRTGALTITDDATGSPHVASLDGSGMLWVTPPTASFTYTCAALTCGFDGSGSSGPQASIVAWTWDFGDGTSGSGPIVNHTFVAGGTYTVTLKVTDARWVTVGTAKPVSLALPKPPTAAFTQTCVGLVCGFDGTGSSDPDGSIMAWSWDFGDGTTGSGPAVNRTFAAEGTYIVTLKVTDSQGVAASLAKPVSVGLTSHTADLDGSTTSNKNHWTATVTITVHDANHRTVTGATVVGAWSAGASGSASCSNRRQRSVHRQQGEHSEGVGECAVHG